MHLHNSKMRSKSEDMTKRCEQNIKKDITVVLTMALFYGFQPLIQLSYRIVNSLHRSKN